MAGIYIHIPFCKTRCLYCDFFTQTSGNLKDTFVKTVCKELILRKNYLGEEPIQTIYFGGGTPSQLSHNDFDKIFSVIKNTYNVSKNSEITIEANPDDLKEDYVAMLRSLPINRISIGIQSFDDNELTSLNRIHSSSEAKQAVLRCQVAGFNNISIDLIYGLPSQRMETWIDNLNQAIQLDIQHISAYHLIYEEKTKLYKLLEKGEVIPVDEDLSVEMFSYMNEYLKKNNFIHYEISNFAKDRLFSEHNTSYWTGEKYLGIGPSAHSFNGESRSWNISSLQKYIDGIEKEEPKVEIERLTIEIQYNDYILTRMRTMWGADLTEIEQFFGSKFRAYCVENITKHIINEDVQILNNKLTITKKGLFVSDTIMSDLMFIN